MSVVLAFLGMVIVSLSVAYQKLGKELHQVREEALVFREKNKQIQDQIISEAESKSREILLSAQTNAQEMLKAADIFSNEYKEEFRSKLLQVIKNEEKEFENLYTTIKSESTNVLTNASKNINTQLAKEMGDFKRSVQVEMQKHIEEYKKASYSRIEQDVSDVVETISNKILRKSLNKEEHKKLVMAALEEAKENNVF